MAVPSQGNYGFQSFPVVDWFCLFLYLWVTERRGRIVHSSDRYRIRNRHYALFCSWSYYGQPWSSWSHWIRSRPGLPNMWSCLTVVPLTVVVKRVPPWSRLSQTLPVYDQYGHSMTTGKSSTLCLRPGTMIMKKQSWLCSCDDQFWTWS
jgi:hypothetical protein